MARVLLIDDSKTVTAALAQSLQLDGHETYSLSSFAELFRVLESAKPQLIVLDLLMPGFDGVQFARTIRKHEENPPPIILYSGSDRELIRIAAREIQPFEIVAKSSSDREIRRAVARALASVRRAARTGRPNDSERSPT